MIPPIVSNEIQNSADEIWIEEHDQIDVYGQPFDDKKRLEWWKTNCSIRNAFNKIGNEIKSFKKTRKKISNREVSWTRIAKLSGCDRNTVKHEKRFFWTSKLRSDLLSEIEKFNNGTDGTEDDDSSYLKKIRILEESLLKSREQVAFWYNKYNDLKYENTRHKKIQEEVEKRIKQKNEEIKNLKKELIHKV